MISRLFRWVSTVFNVDMEIQIRPSFRFCTIYALSIHTFLSYQGADRRCAYFLGQDTQARAVLSSSKELDFDLTPLTMKIVKGSFVLNGLPHLIDPPGGILAQWTVIDRLEGFLQLFDGSRANDDAITVLVLQRAVVSDPPVR